MGKVAVTSRLYAKMIDLLVFMFFATLIPYPFGPIVGFLYSILADALPIAFFRGQSLGKKMFKLRVISTSQDHLNPSVKQVVLRNAPIGISTFFSLIPIWGWIFTGLVGFPLFLIEFYLMKTKENGERLGDAMGDTRVIHV